jgi:hypothetical protein
VRRGAAAAITVVIALAAGACKGREAPAKSNRPARISEPERKRGGDACRAYVARLCACARAKGTKDLDDRCYMKGAKIEALDLALAVDDNPTATAQDVFQAQESARQVIAKCIEENLALDAEGCPP